MKKFSSYGELKNFVETNLKIAARAHHLSESWGLRAHISVNFAFQRPNFSLGMPIASAPALGADASAPSLGTDYYSRTNIQVDGVDEADIVKSDGEYLYVVSGDKVIIIDAYPAENATILSEIEMSENPIEMFINGDKLAVFGRTFAKVYDVSDRKNPTLTRDVSFDGNYFDSRMIGDYVYLVINSPLVYANEINLPEISSNDEIEVIPACEIYYFDIPYSSFEFTTIMSINTQDDNEEISSETFLTDAAQNIFVSSNNIYITYTSNSVTYNNSGWSNLSIVWPSGISDLETEKTIIHKIAIADGKIEYKAQGEVPGHVLNQFSMDEYNGYLRIATTTGWYGANHVYILDEDLNLVGRLEGLAPGEKIYSARFMCNRAYLVTLTPQGFSY